MLSLYLSESDGSKAAAVLALMERRNVLPTEDVFIAVLDRALEVPSVYRF